MRLHDIYDLDLERLADGDLLGVRTAASEDELEMAVVVDRAGSGTGRTGRGTGRTDSEDRKDWQ